MNPKKLLFLFSMVMISLSACKKSGEDPTPTPPPVIPPVVNPPVTYVPDESFKIVAYMPGYRDPATVADAKYKMITHLFFAFLQINPTADGSVLPLTATELSRFNIIKAKAKANNVKFGISVMGAESIFAAVAKNPTTRANFVTNLVNFTKTHSLDGLDMDWEYPRTLSGGPNTEYTALMKELSTQLHNNNKYLSAAITPAVYVSTNKDAIEIAAYQYVDFFNIMQYDGAGYDTAEPLNHASLKMTNASLNVWLTSKSMPKLKAVLGMPLYGKDAAGSSIGYRDIEASGADVNLNVATVNGKTYGYNGIALIKTKTQIAKDRCNGIMFWEFSHDSNSDKSLIRAANDQLGRSY
ncbi:MAG: glycosyl hydrolase family 18 protein [Bacteroidota bacterium]